MWFHNLDGTVYITGRPYWSDAVHKAEHEYPNRFDGIGGVASSE